jgi:hypothetical protein
VRWAGVGKYLGRFSNLFSTEVLAYRSASAPVAASGVEINSVRSPLQRRRRFAPGQQVQSCAKRGLPPSNCLGDSGKVRSLTPRSKAEVLGLHREANIRTNVTRDSGGPVADRTPRRISAPQRFVDLAIVLELVGR